MTKVVICNVIKINARGIGTSYTNHFRSLLYFVVFTICIRGYTIYLKVESKLNLDLY